MRIILQILILLGLLGLFSCKNPLGGDGSTVADNFTPGLPTGTFPDHIVVVSGNNQTGIAGYPVSISLGVVDITGAPVPNVSFTTSVLTGGGSTSSTITSDSAGRITITWTLGTTAGAQTMQIAGSGFSGAPSSMTLTAVAVAGNVSAANSTISGTSPAVANRTSLSTVTITLLDSNGNAVTGLTPSFGATDTGNTNAYGACSVGDGNGVSTCTLSSTHAETKTLSIATPVVKSGASVVFSADFASKLIFTASPASQSAGATLSSTTVAGYDTYNNLDTAFTGTVALAIGTNPGGGTLSGTVSTAAVSGVATFSNLAIDKNGTGYTLVASSGGLTSGTSGAFNINPGTATNIAISSGNSLSGTAGSALGTALNVLVTDGSGNPVPSATVDWTIASGGGTLTSASSLTGGTGLASNTLTLGNTAGSNTVTAKIHGTNTSVTFTETGAASSTIASIAWLAAPATSYTASNSSALTTFTAELIDSHGNLISSNSSTTVTLSLASGTGSLGGTLTRTASSGVATFNDITYTKAQSITLTATENTNHNTVTSSSITVSPNTPSTGTSSISSSASSVNDDGTTATITITLLDAYSNPVPSQSVAFAATGAGNTLVQPSSSTNSSGQATGTISSTVTGAKTLSISTPAGFTGITTTVTFVSTSISAANSTITGTSSIVANGSSTSSITITLLDGSSNGVSGVTPTFSATGSSNSYAACSSSNGSGVSTCTMTSTKAETKTLSITGPVSKSGGTVTFINGPASQLVFHTQPTGGVAQTVSLPTQPMAYIEDANGNLVITAPDATANVTLSLSSGTGALTGTVTQAASGGIATFSGIAADTQGAGKVITATKASTIGGGGTGVISQTSNSFTINPPAPGAFTITSATATAGGGVSVVWGASSNAASYTVTYGTVSGGPYGSTASTSATSPYSVTGLTNGTTYYFMVTAVNVTGSTNGSPLVSATSDSTVPTTPGSPAWGSSYATTTASTPALSWTASTDTGSGLSYYQVALGTTSGGTNTVGWTNIGNVTSYTFTGLSLTNNTAYYATVRAVDGAGNVSAAANSGAFTVDTTAPTTPSAPTWGASYSASTSSTPALSWTASSDAISGISYYKVALGTTVGATDVVSWTNVGNVTSYTFTGLSLSNATSYYASIKAVDNAGNTSAAVNSAAFTVDTTAPTSPGAPSWASSYWGLTTTSPSVSWTASTDAGSGVSYYQIALGTSAGAQNVVAWTSIGNVTSYSFSSLTLTNGSSYYATIRAVDAVGNVGTAANTSSGSNTTFTVDTAAPNPPTAVTNAYTTSSTTSAPALSWTASTSNGAADFAGYQVALGTTAGGTDILTWTNVGNVTSYTPATGFTLIDGTAYYPSVRAYKTTNLTSTTANGNQFAVVTATPTLNFNFMSGSTPMTSTNSSYPSMIQFSRASGANVSPGTYYNSSGVITSAPQNLLLQSQNFSLTWSATRASITANAATAPDGTTTANVLSEDSSAATTHYVVQSASKPATASPYTCSVYAKAINQTQVALWMGGSSNGNYARAVFDLNAGTVALGPQVGGASPFSAASALTPVSVGGGWYRVAITATTNTDASIQCLIMPAAASNYFYTGASQQSVLFWGAQVEAGSTPSSYIYTTTAAAYGPRFDYNPATLALNGLLIEESRANSILHSGDPSSWNIPGGNTMTITGNTTLAPDGTTGATTLTDASAVRTEYIYQHFTVSDSQTWTGSVYIKKDTDTTRFPALELAYSGGTTALTYRVWLNTQTGAVAASNSSTASTIGVIDAGTYWRVWVVGANNATGNNRIDYSIYPSAGTVAGTYSAAATGTAIFWGGQLELGAMPTSYIPTTTVAMTRNADVAIVNGNNSWLNTAAGTSVSNFMLPTSTYKNQGASVATIGQGDGTVHNRISLSAGGGCCGMYGSIYTKAGNVLINQASTASYSITLGTVNKIGTTYSTTYFSASSNGTLFGQLSSANNVPSINEIVIGADINGTSSLNGWMQSVNYYQTQLGDTQLQLLTK